MKKKNSDFSLKKRKRYQILGLKHLINSKMKLQVSFSVSLILLHPTFPPYSTQEHTKDYESSYEVKHQNASQGLLQNIRFLFNVSLNKKLYLRQTKQKICL